MSLSLHGLFSFSVGINGYTVDLLEALVLVNCLASCLSFFVKYSHRLNKIGCAIMITSSVLHAIRLYIPMCLVP